MSIGEATVWRAPGRIESLRKRGVKDFFPLSSAGQPEIRLLGELGHRSSLSCLDTIVGKCCVDRRSSLARGAVSPVRTTPGAASHPSGIVHLSMGDLTSLPPKASLHADIDRTLWQHSSPGLAD